jgi:magnesium-transporting ATPase (P-type)
MEPNADQPKTPESKPGSKPNAKDDLKSLPMTELQAKLVSSPDGLSQVEAQKRLSEYGPNEIEEKKSNPFLKFLTYFWGPIPWMIEAAVILSAVARHWPDFAIILLLLVANAVVGFWEEHQAGNAIAALKATLAIKARVRHDGKWTTPEARELVPGDAIRVRLGEIVPADARLLEGDPIEVDQSALTGESLPAIEELAGVDMLCSDKTGTLTQNKLTLGDPFSLNNVPAEQVILKGAPQVILELSANAGQVKPAIEKAVNEFAVRGFRSLGVARADAQAPWQFLGVLPLFDPPREEAKATIATARQMGVNIKMVTGDQEAIARETAG